MATSLLWKGKSAALGSAVLGCIALLSIRAAQQLAELHSPRAFPGFIPAMAQAEGEEEDEVRREAARALAKIKLLETLRRPPAPLPADLPQLAPLLAGDGGKAIASREGWEERRRALRAKWLEFLGEFPREKAPLAAQVVDSEEMPRFTRRHVKYQIEEGVFTDGYLLVPRRGLEDAARLPAAAVFHQTVATHARQPAGLDPSKPELEIGVQLALRGYVVLCPRCYIFDDGAGYAEHVAGMQARHPTWKGMARMAYDAVRAADYLESLPVVDKDRIGCIGHSLGAKEVLYAAALDERYKAAVFSEGGIGLEFSNWDAVWYLGKSIREPRFDLEHHQLIGLIAPRAFLLLAGESADGARSWAFIDAALPVYRLLGAEDRLGWLHHRLGHRYPPAAREVAEAFLDRFLK